MSKLSKIATAIMTTDPPAVSPEDTVKIPWDRLAEILRELSDEQVMRLRTQLLNYVIQLLANVEPAPTRH